MIPGGPTASDPEGAAVAAYPRDDAMLGWMQVAPFGILTTDTELRVRSWNRWLVSHSGLPEAVVVGRPLFELFPDIPRRGLANPFHRALRGEVAVLSTALHRHLLPLPPPSRDLGVSHMLQTARVAPLQLDGDIVGTITIVEDVTQRERQAHILRRQQEHDRLLSGALAQLLESDRPLEAVAEMFPRIAVPLKLDVFFNFLLNPDAPGLVLHAASGVSAEVRRGFASLGANQASVCNFCARSGETVLIGDVQSDRDPRTEIIRRLGLRSYAVFPLLIGERVLGTLSFGSYARDVMASDEIAFLRTLSQYTAVALDRAQREQALREAQASLSRHAETLETKVAERTARLRETIEELESFSHTVAHDLRAPIRWLSGYTDVLLEEYGETLPPEALAIVRRLRHAGGRLDALTRDLLDFSRIARQDVELRPVDVEDLIGGLVAHSPGLQNRVVAPEGRLGAVLAQRTLLEQCFSNLFENALKFVRPGVAPRIVVRAEPRPEGPGAAAVLTPLTPTAPRPAERETPRGVEEGERWTRIWIEDNGIGIAPEMQGKIFGIFERAKGVDHIPGTGIGLAIVARAMQRMGGACGVESEAGAGARFWLDLRSAP